MFRVRQKVVCVEAGTGGLIGGLGTLARGEIYTVRWVGLFKDQITVRVEEIVRPCGDDLEDFDTPYRASRFRPVVERPTNISIFKAMLNPSNLREEV